MVHVTRSATDLHFLERDSTRLGNTWAKNNISYPSIILTPRCPNTRRASTAPSVSTAVPACIQGPYCTLRALTLSSRLRCLRQANKYRRDTPICLMRDGHVSLGKKHRPHPTALHENGGTGKEIKEEKAPDMDFRRLPTR